MSNTCVIVQGLNELGLMVSAFATIAFVCRFNHLSGHDNTILLVYHTISLFFVLINGLK